MRMRDSLARLSQCWRSLSVSEQRDNTLKPPDPALSRWRSTHLTADSSHACFIFHLTAYHIPLGTPPIADRQRLASYRLSSLRAASSVRSYCAQTTSDRWLMSCRALPCRTLSYRCHCRVHLCITCDAIISWYSNDTSLLHSVSKSV